MKKLRLKRVSLLLALVAFQILTFQNCGEGFKAQNLSLESGLSGGNTNPKVDFVSEPPAVSNQNSPVFQLLIQLAPDAGQVLVSCQVDSEPAVDCASGTWVVGALADGDHVLTLTAEDSQGRKANDRTVSIRIDTALPTVTVSGQPAATSGNRDASIVFSATDSLSGLDRVECSYNAAAYAACVSPLNMTNMPLGAHNLKVRATDKAGNVSAIQNLDWTVDASAPTVNITTRPAALANTTSATFAFTGTSPLSPIASFDCSLDGAAFATCTSPRAFTALAQGAHMFSVRARTVAGTIGSPLTINWTVDTVLPTTPVITTLTTAFSKATQATFSFTAMDAGSNIATYQCSLNGAPFANCTAPHLVTNLADGSHTIGVRAFDGAGNISNTGMFTWTVDTILPVLSFTNTPLPTETATTASFAFTSSDAASGMASLTCQLDAAAAVACTSPHNLANLAAGAHIFRVTATDRAGNARVLTYNWTVTAAGPNGANLYAVNCAGCHGALANSSKSNRSAASISSAITNVASMNYLSNLTPAEVAAIAAALVK